MPTQILSGQIVAVPEPPLLTQVAFASRFTAEEQVALELMMESFPDDATRGALKAADKNLLRSKNGIDPADPRTILGATVTVDALVAAGVIAEEDRDARLAAILAPI